MGDLTSEFLRATRRLFWLQPDDCRLEKSAPSEWSTYFLAAQARLAEANLRLWQEIAEDARDIERKAAEQVALAEIWVSSVEKEVQARQEKEVVSRAGKR